MKTAFLMLAAAVATVLVADSAEARVRHHPARKTTYRTYEYLPAYNYAPARYYSTPCGPVMEIRSGYYPEIFRDESGYGES